MDNKFVRLHIIVLGKIWWPMGAVCSQEKSIQLGDKPFQVHINPTFDEVENWVMSNSGDFSEIVDWNCEMEIIQWESAKKRTHTYETLKAWDSEESEYAYLDTISEYVE